jgi:hypothetical protein
MRGWLAAAGDGNNGTGPGGARVGGGRCHSGPAGDGDDDVKGRPAQARNEKTNLSQNELCGVRGGRSSTLLQFF